MRDYFYHFYLDMEWEAAGILITSVLVSSAWFHLKAGNKYNTALYSLLAGFVIGRLISGLVGPFACG